VQIANQFVLEFKVSLVERNVKYFFAEQALFGHSDKNDYRVLWIILIVKA